MAQRATNKAPGFIRTIGDIIEGASEAPQWLKDQANALNDRYIEIAQSIQGEKEQTAKAVEENLRQNKIEQYGTEALNWLQKPRNLIMSFIGLVLFVIAIRKL